MGKLIYAITTSLDGYMADASGNFDWGMPSEEVHLFFNDLVRTVGTSLMGRKMYEVMKVWEDIPTEGVSGPYMDGPSPAMNEYATLWRATNKIVYSSTLLKVKTANTRLEQAFDARAMQAQVAQSDKDYDIGGPQLAAEAIKAGIVDEYHQIVAPRIVGGGNYWLPRDVSIQLELRDVHTFENGFVHLLYRKKQ